MNDSSGQVCSIAGDTRISCSVLLNIKIKGKVAVQFCEFVCVQCTRRCKETLWMSVTIFMYTMNKYVRYETVL